MRSPALGARLLTALLTLVVAACAPDPAPDSDCAVPGALGSTATDLELILGANPVSPGQEVMLYLSPDALAEHVLEGDALVGLVAVWQCWSGSEWIATHLVHRGGRFPPYVQDYEPGVPVLAIGLWATTPWPILIPDVAPGVYRIWDTVSMSSPVGPPEEHQAVVLVWVR